MERIVIKDLYGRFNYDIEFKDGGLTLLTGPNGFGKTTILSILEALSNGVSGVLFLLDLIFDEIVVHVEDGKKVVVKKESDVLSLDGLDVSKGLFDTIERAIGERYSMLGKEEYYRLFAKNKMHSVRKYLEEIEWNDLDYLKLDKKTRIKLDSLIDRFNDYKKVFGRVMLISDQRLFSSNNKYEANEIAIERINELTGEFFALEDDVKKKYSSISSELDSTYLERLFETKRGITENEYNSYISEIKKRNAQIIKYGFSAFNDPSGVGFESEHAKALKVYFEDYNKKLDVLDDFLNRVELFSGLINRKFLFKHLSISIDKGIRVVDDYNKDIDLVRLSSGEKQEIVVCYDLIFNTTDLSLLMIDEPEMSLHVAWQKCFVDDLKSIMQINQFESIVATHSPQIINGYWDEQVDLGELYG